MPAFKENLQDFFEGERVKIATKIEKTPMEKFFLVFLIILVISTVVLSYFQFKKNLESPFYATKLNEKRGELYQQYQASNIGASYDTQETERLQSQDSDLDGLNDYEELYIYKTSPYFEDSDSDGIWDKQEVQAGTDPTCPEGEQCLTPAATEPESSTSTAITDQDLLMPEYDFGVLGLDLNVADFADLEQQLLSGQMTLEDLGINDPELQSQLDILRATQPEVSDISDEEKNEALDALKNMSADEIRQELLLRGVDESVIAGIDDETLRKVFLQTLNLYQ